MAPELTAVPESTTTGDAHEIDGADQDRGDHDIWRKGPDIPSLGVVMRVSDMSPSGLAPDEIYEPRKRADEVPTLT